MFSSVVWSSAFISILASGGDPAGITVERGRKMLPCCPTSSSSSRNWSGTAKPPSAPTPMDCARSSPPTSLLWRLARRSSFWLNRTECRNSPKVRNSATRPVSCATAPRTPGRMGSPLDSTSSSASACLTSSSASAFSAPMRAQRSSFCCFSSGVHERASDSSVLRSARFSSIRAALWLSFSLAFSRRFAIFRPPVSGQDRTRKRRAAPRPK